jgi:cobalt-zinc-cadmium efflux system outer membrane protein
MDRMLLRAFVLIFISAPAVAQDSYTARQILELAERRSPELTGLRHETAAAAEAARQAGRWSNPVLELGAGRKTEIDGDTRFTRLGLAQELPWPGRLGALERAAEAARDAAAATDAGAGQSFRAEVIRRIFEHQAADMKAGHARERLERFQTVNAFLRSRVFASPQKRAEAAIVRSKVLLLGRAFRELEAEHRIAWNRLNRYVALAREPRIEIPWRSTAPVFTLDDLMKQADENSPRLRVARAELRRRESEADAARREAVPGLVLSGEYNHGEGARPEKFYGLGLAIPLPVLDAHRAGGRAAENLARATAARRDLAADRLREELRNALARYQAAAKSIEELRPAETDRLEKEMRDIDRAFKKGQVDLVTYIEADAEHFEALNAVYDSQADFASAHAELMVLIGRNPGLE